MNDRLKLNDGLKLRKKECHAHVTSYHFGLRGYVKMLRFNHAMNIKGNHYSPHQNDLFKITNELQKFTKKIYMTTP